MVPFPWWWLEEAAAASAGGSAEVSQARPNLNRQRLVSPVLDCCPRRERNLRQVINILNPMLRDGGLRQVSTGVWRTQSGAYLSDRNPTIHDDRSEYFLGGGFWINTTNLSIWVCLRIEIGYAIWGQMPLTAIVGEQGAYQGPLSMIQGQPETITDHGSTHAPGGSDAIPGLETSTSDYGTITDAGDNNYQTVIEATGTALYGKLAFERVETVGTSWEARVYVRDLWGRNGATYPYTDSPLVSDAARWANYYIDGLRSVGTSPAKGWYLSYYKVEVKCNSAGERLRYRYSYKDLG